MSEAPAEAAAWRICRKSVSTEGGGGEVSARGEEAVEVVEADLGPGLHVGATGFELGAVEELEFGDHGLAFFDGIGLEVEDVDDAEVDAADGVGVVVEEGDDVVGEGGADAEFLVDLAFDGGVVGVGVHGEEAFIVVVHVAADADGAFGGEALFAGLFAADVVEDASLVGEEDVGDDLFEGLVRFCGAACGEEVVAAVLEGREVAVDVEIEALKGAELVEEGTSDDENHFFLHGEEICRAGWGCRERVGWWVEERRVSGGVGVEFSGLVAFLLGAASEWDLIDAAIEYSR